MRRLRSILLRPLPFAEADRLAAVALDPRMSTSKDVLTWLRERQRAFVALEAYSGWGFTITGGGEAEAVRGARVTGGLFGLWGFGRIWAVDCSRRMRRWARLGPS